MPAGDKGLLSKGMLPAVNNKPAGIPSYAGNTNGSGTFKTNIKKGMY